MSLIVDGVHYGVEVGDSPGVEQAGNVFEFQYDIAVNSDFPAPPGSPGGVQDYFVYETVAAVTDDDPTKTNTGQSFPADTRIYWQTDTWYLFSQDLIFVKSGSTISKSVGTDTLDLNTGDTILYSLKAKNSNGIEIRDDSTNFGIKIADGGNVGIGTDTGLTDKLTVAGDTTIQGSLVIDEPSTGSYMKLLDPVGGDVFGLLVEAASGNQCVLRLNLKPDGGVTSTLSSSFEIFRFTDTSGPCSVRIFKGDNSATLNCRIGGNSNSYFNVDNNNVGIGTSTPGEKLHVSGNVRQNGLKTVADNVTFADEYVLQLTDFGNNTACSGTVFVYGISQNGIAKFHRDNFNNIVIDYATAGMFASDGSDNRLNIYNVTNILTLHNRLGSSVQVSYVVER
jgi:hypothetical protein